MDTITRNLSELCSPIDNYDSYLYVIGVVTDTISLFGSVFVLLIYIFLKDARNYAYLLIVQLAVADVVSSFGDFLNAGDKQDVNDRLGTACIVQGFLTQAGITASFIWTMIISWTLYATVVLNKHNILEMFVRKLFVGYGVPLLTAIIPLITGDYGSAGHWCWISIDKDPTRANILRLCLFYIPLWSGVVFNFYCYYKVIRMLRRVLPGSTDTNLVVRLRFYPIILIFCWIWSTAYEVYSLIDCNANNAFLNVTSLAFGNLVGFFNAIAYGLNDNIQQILREKIKALYKWLTKPCRQCMERIKINPGKNRAETSSSGFSDYGVEMRRASQMSVSSKNDLETSFASGNS